MQAIWRSVVCISALSWVGAACSCGSNTTSAGLHCGGSRSTYVAIDYVGDSGEASPLAAVAAFVSGPVARGLPTDGYEVDNGYRDGLTHTSGTASSVNGSSVATRPIEVQTVVHRSSSGVDVAVETTNYGSGWQASSASYCLTAKR